MKYYLSDPHFFHKNIIKYSNRPFASLEEMHQTIIDNINERVKPNDELYLLGDVGFASEERILEVLRQIKCKRLNLVWGNHDSHKLRHSSIWETSLPMIEVTDRAHHMNHHVVLCHYMMVEFNRSHHGAFQLFGHSHGQQPGNQQQIDVGVDCWDFKPVTLEEAITRMSTLEPMPKQAHSRE